MQGAGIYSGDLMVVDRSKTARHGDIVIDWLKAPAGESMEFMRQYPADRMKVAM